jgi:hypothetical protein
MFAGVKTLFWDMDGNRVLLIRDRTREIALRLSNKDDWTLLKLLLGENREGVKTELAVEFEVSVEERFGTETLLGFVDMEPGGSDATVFEQDAVALLSLPEVGCRGSDLPKTPLGPLLLDPNQAIEQFNYNILTFATDLHIFS